MPPTALRCSSSRTCTGPTTRCSTSSSISRTGRQACRCCSSAPPVRSCTSSTRRSGRPARNAQRDQPGAAHGRGDGACSSPRCSSRRCCQTTAQRDAARARGRESALRGGVRAPAGRPRHADGRGRAAPARTRVQALIAARLDTLSPERKSLLQDAAVIGKVFWAGALAEMGGRDRARGRAGPARALPQRAGPPCAHVARWRARPSTASGTCSSGTSATRRSPAPPAPRRHRAAAAWIERKAGERAEDLAEVLAHHHRAGARARPRRRTDEEARRARGGGDPLSRPRRRSRARPRRRARGGRAWPKRSRSSHDRPGRASLLERWAHAAQQQGRLREAKAALEEAIALYRARGDSVAAGRSLTALIAPLSGRSATRAGSSRHRGDRAAGGRAAGPELVAAYASSGACTCRVPPRPKAIRAADRALSSPPNSGCRSLHARSGFRGSARASLGEREGLDDMRRTLALSLERGRSRDAGVLLHEPLGGPVGVRWPRGGACARP